MPSGNRSTIPSQFKGFDFSWKNRIRWAGENLRCPLEFYGNIHFYALNGLLKIYYLENFLSDTFFRIHREIKLSFILISKVTYPNNIDESPVPNFCFPFSYLSKKWKKIFQASHIFEMANFVSTFLISFSHLLFSIQ